MAQASPPIMQWVASVGCIPCTDGAFHARITMQGADMNNLLRSITDELGSLLDSWLPQLSADWWERHVLAVLTFQQQERVKHSRITGLSGLDLAALLRVLDQNWYDLSQRH